MIDLVGITIRLLLAASVAAASSLLVVAVSRWAFSSGVGHTRSLRGAWRRIRPRHGAGSDDAWDRLLVAYILAVVVTAFGAWASTGSLLVAAAVTAVFLRAPHLVADHVESRRRHRLKEQLPDGLVLIANALRSNMNLERAIDFLIQEMPPPISTEFAIVRSDLELGARVEEALERLRERGKDQDLDLFVTSVQILREKGGNIAEFFQRIVDTVADRKRLHLRVRGMLAQNTAQAVFVALFPLVAGAFMYWFDPRYMSLLFQDPVGHAFLVLAILFESLGVTVIWRMLRIEE